jgi:hypothetical protein
MSREPRRSQGLGVNSYSPVAKLQDYRILSCIGQGSFGVIHKVERISDKTVSILPTFQKPSVGRHPLPSSKGICDETARLLQDESERSATDVVGSVSRVMAALHAGATHLIPTALI